MNKILILFKREYRAAVRTKSFIISLILVPLLMGGGFLAMIIMEKNQDTDDKRIAVIDYSGFMEAPLKKAVDQRNQLEIFISLNSSHRIRTTASISSWPCPVGCNRGNYTPSSRSDRMYCTLPEMKADI
jgi:ABC-type Na+ efflux pump permease subunit